MGDDDGAELPSGWFRTDRPADRALVSPRARRWPGRLLGVGLIVGTLVLGTTVAVVAVAPGSADASGPVISAEGTGPTATPANRASTTFTLAASGDVLLHEGTRIEAARQARLENSGEAFDFAPLFADVRQLVKGADLAICHAEVPLSAPGGPYTGFPRFSGPPEVAKALVSTGYDSCSTASNHTVDKGLAGIGSTLDAMDAAGLHHTGSARSADEAGRPLILRAKGVRVAQLSYTFGLNGLPKPAGAPWSANLIDPDAILRDAAAARAAGAQMVVLSLHWGTEFRHEVTPDQRALAHRLLASPDIDLILGHHVHVVQPIERVNGKYVVYGMGNLLAAGSHNFADGATREGILPTFTFTGSADGRFAVTDLTVSPLYISTVPHLHVVDVASALTDAKNPELGRLRQAEKRTRQWVLSEPSAAGVQVR